MTDNKRKRGRPATGQNTKVIRVPLDFDREVALQLYYDVLPALEYWSDRTAENPTSPRYDAMRKLFAGLVIPSPQPEGGEDLLTAQRS